MGLLSDDDLAAFAPAERALPRTPAPTQIVSSDEYAPQPQSAGARLNDVTAGRRRALESDAFTRLRTAYLEQGPEPPPLRLGDAGLIVGRLGEADAAHRGEVLRQPLRTSLEQAVEQLLQFVVEVVGAGEQRAVDQPLIGAFGADRALAHQPAEQGLDGGLAPQMGRPHLGDQAAGPERTAAPERGHDGALRLGDRGAAQGFSTVRSMRASTAQWKITAITPANRPSTSTMTISAMPGAAWPIVGGVGALETAMKNIRPT